MESTRVMSGIDAARFRKRPPARFAPFADPAFWETRYQASKEAFEWYLGWENLKEVLLPLLVPEGEPESREAEILVLGCGTSLVSQELYAEGFNNVTNVDRCEFVVQAMRERHQEQLDVLLTGAAKGKKGGKDTKGTPTPEPGAEPRKHMQFEAFDALSLPKEWARRFDVVIDKAVLDAVACGASRWDSTEALMRSVCAVLKPKTGIYFCVSHAGPEVRQKMLVGPHQEDPSDRSEAYGWVVRHETLPRPLVSLFADPKAKDKMELTRGPVYNAEKDVYHIYICQVLPPQ